jgi:GT2 family glycosyltransferase
VLLSEFNICVAILNWNGRHHLERFLPSVVKHSGNARIRVIDNASSDDSVEWLKREFPDVELDVLDQNYGFTGGYNRGIEHTDSELIVLLNSDVEVQNDWLAPLLKRMNQGSKIAACQPKILALVKPESFEYAGASGGFLDLFGYPFCRGRIFDTCEADSGQYNDARPIFWASGACMMVRKKHFIEAGGLEERFFAHMEEIDLCWRFLSRGLEVWIEPESEVLHLGGGTLAKSNPRKTFLNFRNGLAMLYMNTHGLGTVGIIIFRLMLDGLAGIQFLMKGELNNCLAIIRAHFSFYTDFGYWSSKRKINRENSTSRLSNKILFRSSLVMQYFLKGKKRFSELNFQ